MKKILFLVNHDLVIYNFRKELVTELLNQGYEVIISSPYGEKIDRLIQVGAKFVETKIDRRGLNPLKDLKLIRHYKKKMLDIEPDIVLTFTIKPNIYGGLAAKKLKIPYIANITGLGSALENEGILQKITTILYKRAFKEINTVFFQNEENMRFFHDKKIAVGKHKLLAGSGVNLEEYKLINYPTDEVATKFIFIGRIMKDKGIEEYLSAAIQLKSIYNNLIEFYVVGFYEEKYKRIIEELHSRRTINYLGYIDNIREVLKDIHCVVLPSYHEGMSNVLLEAQATGRPVIGTDVSGVRETFVHTYSGLLCKKADVNDLVRQMIAFHEYSVEKKAQMGINGRQHVEEKFDRKIVINEYIKKIMEVTGDVWKNSKS